MRILITSGGTKIPIDPVRSITNTSTGRFGAHIAKAALIANMDVIYLVSAEGQSPFTETFNAYQTARQEPNKNVYQTTSAVLTHSESGASINHLNSTNQETNYLAQLYDFFYQYRDHYHEHRYTTFAEYSQLLQQLILQHQPDVVILAAAVSDYLISDYSVEKIRSQNQLSLELKPAPKLIHEVKKWLPSTFLVGFKLLIDASDSELVSTAMDSIIQNNADLIAANNLSSLQRGQHEILLVERDGSFQKIKEHLAEAIIERVIRRSS